MTTPPSSTARVFNAACSVMNSSVDKLCSTKKSCRGAETRASCDVIATASTEVAASTCMTIIVRSSDCRSLRPALLSRNVSAMSTSLSSRPRKSASISRKLSTVELLGRVPTISILNSTTEFRIFSGYRMVFDALDPYSPASPSSSRYIWSITSPYTSFSSSNVIVPFVSILGV